MSLQQISYLIIRIYTFYQIIIHLISGVTIFGQMVFYNGDEYGDYMSGNFYSGLFFSIVLTGIFVLLFKNAEKLSSFLIKQDDEIDVNLGFVRDISLKIVGAFAVVFSLPEVVEKISTLVFKYQLLGLSDFKPFDFWPSFIAHGVTLALGGLIIKGDIAFVKPNNKPVEG
ncbi:MAG: hypothetical protein OCD01_04120 [Fibrobacterales bacterium]